jgi:hypothetical protein
VYAGEKDGLTDFQSKLLDIALNHPKIGIKQATVPFMYSVMQQHLVRMKSETPYMKWREYCDLAELMSILKQTK